MANASVFETGYDQGLQRGSESRLHKQALSDKEHDRKVALIVNDLNSNKEKLSALKDANDNPLPGYDETLHNIQNNFRDLRELHDPQKYPGAIQRTGWMVTDALHITNPQERIKKEGAKRAAGAAADEHSALSWAGAAPIAPAQEAAQKYEAGVNAQLSTIDKSNMSDEDKERARAAVFKIYQRPNYKFLDVPGLGTQMFDMNDPDSIPEGAVPHVKETITDEELSEYKQAVAGGFKGTIQEFRASKSGKMTAGQLLQDSYLATLGFPSGTPWETLTNQQRSGYQLYLNGLKQRTANHQATITDRDGNVHVIDLSSTSGPVEMARPATSNQPPEATGGQPAPTTPQAVKNKAASIRPRATKADIVLNFKKATPDYTKAKNTYNDTERISKLADKWILQPNSEADANFVLALIRSEAGRVNQQEIGQMFNAGGISEAPERWAAKAGHGELAPDLRKQLVDFVHLQRDAAKEVVDEMDTGSSGTAPKGPPTRAFGTVNHNGKNYYVDAQGNNLGVAP